MSNRRQYVADTSKSRPVQGVDLVSNSDRMLRAHHRNQHQGHMLCQKLDELDKKLRQKVFRMKHDIRRIYFEEELPRQYEVLEMDARRRDSRSTAQVTNAVTPVFTFDRGCWSGVTRLTHQPLAARLSKASIHKPSRLSTHRISEVGIPSSRRSPRAFIKNDFNFEGVERDQRTTEEIIESVREVARRAYIARPQQDPEPSRNFASAAFQRMGRLPIPGTKPKSLERDVKERFEALMKKLREKTAEEGYHLPEPFDGVQEELKIDFNDPKWKPYKILIEKDRCQSMTRKNSVMPKHNAPRLSFVSIQDSAENQFQFRVDKNWIINGRDDGDSDSMSFVFSRNQLRSQTSAEEDQSNEGSTQLVKLSEPSEKIEEPTPKESEKIEQHTPKERKRSRVTFPDVDSPRCDIDSRATTITNTADLYANDFPTQLGLERLRMGIF